MSHEEKDCLGLFHGRVLTAAERTANYQVDRARFLVPAPRDVSPYTVVHAATTVIFR